ncbi:MAG: glycosyltransferase family 4 protein [Chloroflexi bacterium]|nr:glycosyltransferase family 4 protein [Chloroflexota bacterium]
MKILHVVRQFYPCVGGVEKFTLDLCRYSQAAGHEVAVLTLNRDFASGSRLPDRDEVNGLTVHRVPYFGPNRYKMAPAVLRHLAGYDLLHVHCLDFFVDYLALTKPLHRRPLVLSTHGGFFHSSWGRGLKDVYFRTITRLALRAVDRIVCDSPQDLDLFRRLAPDKCLLINNGVDYDNFVTVRKRLRPGLLVYVGRTDANKRIDRLIEATARLTRSRPGVRLALVGPDWLGEWPRLRQLAAELGIGDKVDFVGQVAEDGLRSWLAEAHFFVSASVYEGFGIAAVEAMATGTVPLLNDIPAFRHLTDEGTAGLLVDFSDPERAAQAIDSALAMPIARYEEIANRAREAASRYGWRAVVGRFLSVYQEVLASRPEAQAI